MIREQISAYLMEQDPELALAIAKERQRQENSIELIASENITSAAVNLVMSTCLNNKYAEGYPGKRYYGGCEHVDVVETIAIERACELFGADHANVQPHSGASANLAVFKAVMKPGDCFLSMSLKDAGHLSHGSPANISGTYFQPVHYPLDPETETIDYDAVRKLARECKPTLIITGGSAYPRFIDFEFFRKVADEAGAVFMVDMAHIAGLVAAGVHPSPIPYADIASTTTHKTLRGPRGGLLLCKENFAKAIDSAVFPGTQGGPLEHIIAAKALCFGEAMKPEFKEYQKQVLANCRALAEALAKEGFRLVSGGSDNHLILIDLRPVGITGRDFELRLDEIGITTNKNAVPGDTEKFTITSGLRVGTPAVTTRGFKEDDMEKIAVLMGKVAKGWPACKDEVAAEVAALVKAHPIQSFLV